MTATDWRVANSLVELEREVKALYPNYTFGTIGDAAHQAEASDHNPEDDDNNPATPEVVCACDIMIGGVNMSLAERIRLSGHPDLKYVIHNQMIASRNNGFQWRTYTGSNPHTDHIHVSVGVGPDGQSREPFDDTVTWNIVGMATLHRSWPTYMPIATDYFGPVNGPNQSHGGFYVGQRPDIKAIQSRVVQLGYVPGVTDPNGSWVDGIYGPKTTAAVSAMQHALWPASTKVFGQVWHDDWIRLFTY